MNDPRKIEAGMGRARNAVSGLAFIGGALLILGAIAGYFQPIKVPVERQLSERTKELEAANRELGLAEFSLQRMVTGFAWFSRDGRVLRTNPAHCAMLGYTETEMLAMRVFDLNPALSPDVWEAHWQQIRERKYLRTEAVGRRKDGSTFQAEVDVHHMEFGGEELKQELEIAAGYAALAIEQKQVEDSKREQEAWHKAVLEAWPDLIFICDAKGRLKEYHASKPEHLMMPPSEFIGKSIPELFPDELAERMERGRIGALENGGVCSVEYEAMVPRGKRYFEARYVRYGADETLSMVSDITDRKKSEVALEQSHKRFEHLFELAPDAMVMTDRTGVITMVNRSFETMFGWSREELLGELLEGLVPPDLQAGHRGLREEFFERPVARLAGEGQPRLKAMAKGGRAFPVEIKLSPIEMDDGTAMVASVRDLSDRLESERRALRSQRLESLGTLASGVAHDLNNTFVPILMAVDMLKEKQQAPFSYLELIENGAQRGADMVRQLLAFAKGGTGRRVPLDPHKLIEDIERMVRGTFPKSIRLDFQCLPVCPAISGDPTQLHQVLLNLCVNARDAMPNGGTLRLRAEGIHCDKGTGSFTDEIQPGFYVRMTVADTGTGIAQENLDRIFEPFFTTKAPHSGSGLGLASVLGIVKGHDGFLRVESELGHGAIFEIYFPAHSSGVPSPKIETLRSFSGKGEWVLVVDDEGPVRATLRMSLEGFNLNVLTAIDGKDALAQFGRHRSKVDFVLTDLNMPVLDGLSLVAALRSIAPGIRIVVMSGLMDDANVRRLDELGVNAKLLKPFKIPALVEMLRTVLAKPDDRGSDGGGVSSI